MTFSLLYNKKACAASRTDDTCHKTHAWPDCVRRLAASRYPEFKALLTGAGAEDMSWYMTDQHEDAKTNGFTKMQFYWRGPLNLSLAWYNDVRNISPSKEVAHFKDPVLAIAGADHTFNIFTGDMSKFNEIMPVTTVWFLKKL